MSQPLPLHRKLVACLSAAALASTVCVPTAALAAESSGVGSSFTVDGITYLVTAAGEVSVGNGTRSLAVDHDVTGAKVTIPETVESGGESYTVTAINKYAFQDDTVLSAITLPSTVKSISGYAFDGCGTMDESGAVPVYKGLETVSFSGTPQLRYISEYAFNNCYNLESFTMPASLQSLGSYSFSNCFSFKTLQFAQGAVIEAIGANSFEVTWQKGFVTPEGWDPAKEWGENDTIFYTADFETANANSKVYGGLEKIVLPASVEIVGERAFANQRCLKELIFENDDMEYFDEFAFAFCTSLTDVTVPTVGHMFSADEGYKTGLSNHLFSCCTNLKSVTFNQIKAPSGRWNGLSMFDGCRKLDTVVFNYNKIVPASSWTFLHDSVTWGYNSSDPTVYLRVGFARSASEAKAGSESLGWAVLREGTQSRDIAAGMAASDAAGAVVLRGSVPALPSGYDAWALVSRGGERSYAASEGIEDVCFAYPVKSSDLSYGGIELSASSFWYDGQAHLPSVTVVDAMGNVLPETSYSLSWERQNASGAWGATTDLSSPGALKAVATGTGAYSGTARATFEIRYLDTGTTFESGGITYCVSKGQTASSPAELQVGDGEHAAVDAETNGAVAIPAKVVLEGSNLELPVTSVASNAFGSSTASAACGDIASVELPEGIVSIGDYAFANMGSLASVEIPASVQSIGTGAFTRCPVLSSVTFRGESLQKIGTSAFAYCTGLKSVQLPAITGSFLGFAFQGCVMLSSVTFTGKVAGSDLAQFDGCNRLTSVTYQDAYWDYGWAKGVKVSAVAGSGASKARCSVTVGKKGAIYATCLASGTSATVPAAIKLGSTSYSVTSIAASALKGSKVKTLTVKGTGLTKASVKNSLKGSKVATVKVPKSKLSAYKKAFAKANSGKAVTVKKA